MTRPKLAVLSRPTVVDQLDRHDVKVQLSCSPRLLRDEESRFSEHAEMLHDRDAAHVEILADVVHAATWQAFDHIEDFPPMSAG